MKIRCLFDKLIPVKELKQHPKNNNLHTDAQVRRLAEILEYQGWRYPIKVSKLSGYITSGHGRLLAALLNKWEEVPVNYQEYESVEQEYADVVADNAIALWSELNIDQIKVDICDFGPDFDVSLLGSNNPAFLAFTNIDEASLPDLGTGEKSELEQITFTLHCSQAERVKDALAKVKSEEDCENPLNTNSNGNAIFIICDKYLNA